MKNFRNLILLLLCGVAIASCNKPDAANVQAPLSNEFLTTTILNLKNLSNPSDTPKITYYLNPNTPSVPPVLTPDTLVLSKNATYSCNILILDQTKTPPDTVSNVLKQRANIHLFVYYPSTGLMLADSITDHDTNVPPLPFGLQSQMKTVTASNGTLEIVLRHQPYVKDGSPTPGSTDLDVSYPVSIK